jgi:hypothetical protein
VKPARQRVLKKAAQELVAVQRHDFRLVVATISVSKRYGLVP